MSPLCLMIWTSIEVRITFYPIILLGADNHRVFYKNSVNRSSQSHHRLVCMAYHWGNDAHNI